MEPYYSYEYSVDAQAYWRRQHLRRLRHDYSVQGWALLLYMGIMNATVTVVMCVDMVVQMLWSYFTVGTVDEQWVMDKILRNSGWGYMLSIAIGFLLLLLWKKPKFVFGTIWQKKHPMKVGSFLQILSIFMSAQMVFILLGMLMNFLLNLIGVEATTETALDMDGLSMFLYVGLGAPIAEEILFRGLILRSMEPYGKKFAIFASALLFGLFHGNLSQTPFAFVVGLVLGYVTLEHNIAWAMVLHMFNNLIISDTMTRLLTPLTDELEFWISFGVIGLFTLVGVVTLIVQHKKIFHYLTSNRDDPDCAKAFWTAPGIIVLVVILCMTICAVTVLSLIPM